MTKTILIEASALSEFEKMDLFNQGKRRENLAACKVEKLIRYYQITLNHALKFARIQIEAELDRRILGHLIVPMRELTAPIPEGFTLELAQIVIDARGDIAPIIRQATKAFSYGTVIIQAYVMAIVFGETVLANKLEAHIKQISTYTKYMRRYLELCQINSGVLERLTKLANDMEDYKAWA